MSAGDSRDDQSAARRTDHWEVEGYRSPDLPGHDPLAALRGPGDPDFDVFVAGQVFLDIIFTGLGGLPAPGTEVMSDGMGSSPGGTANLAIALSRLGLRTALAAAFGHDVYGDFCWHTLAAQEGVDLTSSRKFDDWHSPVTVSLAYDGDRSMVTHGHRPPIPADEMIGTPPSTRACFVDLRPELDTWVTEARKAGAVIFADVGWDPTEQWAPEVLESLRWCHAFLPNAPEATAYTRTDSPEAALARLSDIVPVVVITRGDRGALAVDGETGEYVDVPALPVRPLDATGAGDVFAAGFIAATLAQWPLLHRVRFANLTAALSVQHFGGSLSAPGWADIAAWWDVAKRVPGLGDVARDYAFFDDVVPQTSIGPVRRATATIGFQTDA